MSNRASGSRNPALSVATDAELSAVETGYLLDGELLFSKASGLYILDKTSTAAVSATILPTADSGNGSLPGRLIFTGITPGGGGGVIAVNSYAQLDAVPAGSLQQGTRLYLVPQHASWFLRAGTAPAGASTDEARTALSTVAKWWERESQGSDEWWRERNAAEGSVTIDGDTGADDAVGSSAAPLRSFDEFIRRTNGVMINAFFQVNLRGSVLRMTKPYAPLGAARVGYVLITGTWTTIGTGNLTTAVAFNRATNAQSEYAATVAGQSLTSYISGLGPYQLLDAGSNQRGWILKASGVGADVLCNTYSNTAGNRVSIANGTQITVRKVTTACASSAHFSAANCQIEIDIVAFTGNQLEIDGGDIEGGGFTLSQVSAPRTYATGLIFAADCKFGGLRSAFMWPAFDNCVVFGDSFIGRTCNSQPGAVSYGFNAPSFQDSQVVLYGGNLSMNDPMVANSGVNYDLAACTLYLPTTAWGPNGGGATPSFQLTGPSTYVAYNVAANITQGIGGGGVLARLTSSGGTNTDAANSAALPIRSANAFIGFVN